MAKEFPYFRFTVAEWMNGGISRASKNAKGSFMDICSYYWFKDCKLTKQMLNERFPNDNEEIKELIKLKIIKEKNNGKMIKISFLDEQYKPILEISKKRAKAGKIGGLRRVANEKQMLKQMKSKCLSYKDKYNYKDRYQANASNLIRTKDVKESITGGELGTIDNKGRIEARKIADSFKLKVIESKINE